MCCNYCYYFNGCKKSKKTKSSCCSSCAEYEFCPFVTKKTAKQDTDTALDHHDNIESAEAEPDIDIYGDEEL